MPSTPALIYYHADCLDGFGAAYAAWRHFGVSATYRPMNHGDAWLINEVTGRNVFILDFSFRRPALEEMAQHAASVCQIDHHASARDGWAADLSNITDSSMTEFQHPELPLKVIFDMNKSGARLAWEHFHPEIPPPLTLRHIEDQDLWRFNIEGTRSFCTALRLQPFDFGIWDQLISEVDEAHSDSYVSMLTEGQAIQRFMAGEIQRLADSRLVMTVSVRGDPTDPLQSTRHGTPVLIEGDHAWRRIDGLAINASALFASELGNLLAMRSGTFALIWQVGADGYVKASLRACNTIDVARLAASFGGGGHPNAAGFRMPLARFTREILGLVN
jgi:oligoribonuclease NrnB/cAMP/cGMP phosphodiesterase (DHH superfamily)